MTDPKTDEKTAGKVESGKPVRDDDPVHTAAAEPAPGQDWMDQLEGLNERLGELGYTIADVLIVAAKNAFGVDVRPLPAPPTEGGQVNAPGQPTGSGQVSGTTR